MAERESGYTHCGCGTCFEIAIGEIGNPETLCWQCEDAGCEPGEECQCEAEYDDVDC